MTDIDKFPFRGFQLSFAEALSFIETRRAPGSEPLSHFFLSVQGDLTLRDFRTLIRALPSTLRSIHIDQELFSELHTNPTLIAILDESLPQLEEVAIAWCDGFNTIRHLLFELEEPLVGLPNLKTFTFLWMLIGNRPLDPPARYVCQLGRDDCVYRCPDVNGIKRMQEFGQRVKELKR